ncbi:MAG: hypothetical protein RDU89_01550 [bacterium]|nr:hypothetical protein [bacterium]
MTTLGRHNLLALLVGTVLAALALGMLALLLIGLSPSSLGSLVQEHLESQVYAFENLELTGQYLKLDLEDGRIIPVLRAGQVGGAVVLGSGSFRLDWPPSEAERFSSLTGRKVLEDGFQALYLRLDYQGLEDLKALALASTVAAPEALAAARAILARNREDPTLLWLFGVARRFGPGPACLARIQGYGYPEIFYAEGEAVEVTIPSLGPEGRFTLEPVGPAGSFFAAPAAPGLVLPVPVGVFGAGVLLVLALAYTLTADLAPRFRHPAGDRRHLVGLLVALPAAELLGRLLVAGTMWANSLLYLVLALVVVGWARSEGLFPAYLGLSRGGGGRAILSGVFVGGALVLSGSLAVPRGLVPCSPAEVATLAAGSFLVGGLLPEIYRRGLVHNGLERLGWPPALAVTITAFLASGAQALPRLLAAGQPTPSLWLELLVTAPMAFVVAGFLYHRTRSVFSSATALWLVTFLPEILRF